ncbi:MOSC domain-containing protein [Virgibacillus kekensis]|uniref:MOSC domain-containing protein n=1 Tax=Virgibacillus kekensis TaxID=202261 RepID=A0ABV9DIV1_9BACI
MLIGQIKEIVRHPVKSFRGENVQKTKIMDYGLYGDRSHALIDESNNRNFLSITQFQEMVRYKARFVGEERVEEYPKVEIVTPEGNVFDWDNKELMAEIEQKSNRKVSTITYPPAHVPIGPIAEENIQLVTDASLNKIEELWGEAKIDHRRFRPNLIISLEDKNPFEEEKWFGKRLKIGPEVEIELIRHCKRCMIITVNPDNAERSPDLHKTVAKERKNNFGVYASVIKTGDIHVEDEVHLLD